jgi:two-component system sensor histidine kinase ChvG
MFRGILSKILGLLVMFNLALWAFVIATEDAALVEVHSKKDRLFERSNFYVKLLQPIFQQDGLSEFDRRLAIKVSLEGKKRKSYKAGSQWDNRPISWPVSLPPRYRSQ